MPSISRVASIGVGFMLFSLNISVNMVAVAPTSSTTSTLPRMSSSPWGWWSYRSTVTDGYVRRGFSFPILSGDLVSTTISRLTAEGSMSFSRAVSTG